MDFTKAIVEIKSPTFPGFETISLNSVEESQFARAFIEPISCQTERVTFDTMYKAEIILWKTAFVLTMMLIIYTFFIIVYNYS